VGIRLRVTAIAETTQLITTAPLILASMSSSLLWLTLGAFSIGTEGFMIAGLLNKLFNNFWREKRAKFITGVEA
jgi:ABC-type uncharacterized transport system permease subunit